MATVRRNIASNLVGGAWIAALTLAITPMQVNILGAASYGLIGFIATLQIMFGVFDLGLSNTITRQVASDTSSGHAHSEPLLRTAAAVYWLLAVVIGGVVAVGAPRLARFWFNAGNLDPRLIEHGLRVVALYLALRWPVALYTGVLSGMQRMDLLNAVKVGAASVRMTGGIAVLLVWRDLAAFLWWTSISAVAEVLAYAAVCRRAHPQLVLRPAFSLTALQAVWGYSLRMTAISLLTVIITLFDRLVLSKLLPLEAFGYYALAYNTAAGTLVVLSAVSSAMLPSYAAAHGGGAAALLAWRYRNATGTLLFLAGFPIFALIFFGRPILAVWVSAAAAEGAWQSMALLAAGFWFSCAASNAYNVALACGRPGMPLRNSALSALPYCALLLVLTRQWGAPGAAASWLALNLWYVATLVPAVHRELLGIPMREWLKQIVLPFLSLGIACFGGAAALLVLAGAPATGTVPLAALMAALAAYGAGGYHCLGSEVRTDLRAVARRLTGQPS